MCLLMPFLPSCLLKIYLVLKQAGHGGQERLFTHRGGNRTQALERLLLPSAQPPFCIFPEHPETPVISIFYFTDSSYLSANLCWCSCTHDDSPIHFSATEHVFINIAHTGLNPRPGDERRLQQMRTNYINCLPIDGPSSFPLVLGLTSSLT